MASAEPEHEHREDEEAPAGRRRHRCSGCSDRQARRSCCLYR
ncbi:hypothetical protein NC651_023383 [Populus alba x Populus x berolinensis]|nr:hypothetical protein NC651_023383 [Populus alba x Populus x berolinensis]